MNELKRIKAILFDLDGTLVYDEEIQKKALTKTIDSFNLNISLNEFFQRFTGKNLVQIEEDLIKEFEEIIKKGEFRKRRKDFVVDLLSKQKTRCTHYAKEFLEFVSQKYPLAICSAGEKEEILLKLKNNDLLKYFKKIISAGDVERSKPYPDIYLKGAKELGFEPRECLSFEDSVLGVQAAKSAGTICFVVPNKKANKEDFSIADRILESLEEAYNILKNI